jgi:CPA2 family monovalent cation:H+ antiporter-2
MESPQEHAQLTGLAIVVVAALACGLTMKRFKQPAVLGYILAGVILGPSGLGLVGSRTAVSFLAELGVLMLLFVIGMEMSLRGIREVWRIALITTILQISVGLGAMLGLGQILGWPLPLALLLGFVVALSSTAVAIKMLEEIGELRTRVGRITVGVLVAQDLAVVPMMLIIGSFRPGTEMGLESLVQIVLSVVFLVLLIAYLSRRRRLRLPFARAVGQSIDLTPLAGLAFCFGAASLSGLLGLSAAYGAFLAGLVIGNSTSRRIMIHTMAPIQSVLIMVFFLSIGLLLDLSYLVENLWLILVIVTFVAVFKTALNIFTIRLLGETWPRAFLSGALLAQLGEFSFILAALGISVGAVSPDHYRLIVAVTVLSLIGSPFWLEASRRLHRIVLMGVTSGRETVRLAVGGTPRALLRSTRHAEDRMVRMASSATAWIGDIMPRGGRPPDGPRPDVTPGLGQSSRPRRPRGPRSP